MQNQTLEQLPEADSRTPAEELQRQTEQAEGVTFTEFLQQTS